MDEMRFLRIALQNNLKVQVLYSYNLKKIQKSLAVRFVYALKGRDKNIGIVEEFGGEFIASACFFIPFIRDKEMQEIMKQWGIHPIRKILLTC